MGVEEIILADGRRGMGMLAPHLPPGWCRAAAEDLLRVPRGVVGIATGFWAGGRAETDGPPGAWALARGLRRLGHEPVILGDAHLGRVWPSGEGDEVEVLEVPMEPAQALGAWWDFRDHRRPVALVAVERCGRCRDGSYRNMRGQLIDEHTAPLDLWFMEAGQDILTVGIGDGGNEIGMGNVAGVITDTLGLQPCVVETRHLLVATVSNWGAYGLIACLGEAASPPVQLLPRPRELQRFLAALVRQGAVDGTTGEATVTVDGRPMAEELWVLRRLRQAR